MSVGEKVKSIIRDVKPLMDLEVRDDLVDGGFFDSLEIIAIISMLNESFDIEIQIDDIIPENFNSIDSITRMAERLINLKEV